jgi:hypothetical protein
VVIWNTVSLDLHFYQCWRGETDYFPELYYCVIFIFDQNWNRNTYKQLAYEQSRLK